MKKYLNKTLLVISSLVLWACAETNYPGGVISPYIGTYDVRNLYKGSPVTLSEDNLEGSSKVAVLVTSDHSGNNIPSNLMFAQDARRLDFLRGLAYDLGSEAKNYLPGDSLIIDILGAELDRVDGILTLRNLSSKNITKVASGKPVSYQRANVSQIIKNPGNYESTLTVIVKGGFNPIPAAGSQLKGTWKLNDGFGDIEILTDNQASFANNSLYRMANYYGLVFSKLEGDSLIPFIKPRVQSDIVELKSEYKTPKVVITGWMNDPVGGDGNHEYIQFMATEDIDFVATPYSVITTNNAGASTPTGYPSKGWITGGLRTYKFNLTSGSVKKGEFFYVGGNNKLINGPNSTNISDAKWILNRNYVSNDGADGVGTKTSGLLANSGNAYGISIFQGTAITEQSIPEDVMFVATGGSLFGNGYGYRITNTDFYDIINPITLAEQPFYRSGTNTTALTYNTPTDAGYFNYLGGEFNLTLGRWTKARAKYAPQLTKESTLQDIENPEFATKLIE